MFSTEKIELPAAEDSRSRYICLFDRLTDRLRRWNRHWQQCVDRAGIERGIRRRIEGATFSDKEVFEALILASLSGNTQWTTIARIRSELAAPFEQFELARFASLSSEDIGRRLVPWFLERRAGSTNLKTGLLRLRDTAAILAAYVNENGQAEGYFLDAATDSGGGPEALAEAIGSKPSWKLPGFGIALAAEALRNLGFDVSKPDRHVMRCIGAWRLVEFKNWQVRGEYTAPQAKAAELVGTMHAVRQMAIANGPSVSYLNSVIWTAGAVSGARLTNNEFREIARAC